MLRVTRHDRNEMLLADCQSDVVPARGEVLQLDTVESDGTMIRPSTMWRVVAVTVHVLRNPLDHAAPPTRCGTSRTLFNASISPVVPASWYSASSLTFQMS